MCVFRVFFFSQQINKVTPDISFRSVNHYLAPDLTVHLGFVDDHVNICTFIGKLTDHGPLRIRLRAEIQLLNICFSVTVDIFSQRNGISLWPNRLRRYRRSGSRRLSLAFRGSRCCRVRCRLFCGHCRGFGCRFFGRLFRRRRGGCVNRCRTCLCKIICPAFFLTEKVDQTALDTAGLAVVIDKAPGFSVRPFLIADQVNIFSLSDLSENGMACPWTGSDICSVSIDNAVTVQIHPRLNRVSTYRSVGRFRFLRRVYRHRMIPEVFIVILVTQHINIFALDISLCTVDIDLCPAGSV